MLGFMGINLMFDREAINPMPTVVSNINDVSVSSAKVTNFVITKDVTNDSTNYEDYESWDINTIMNAMFNGTLAAGSVDFLGQTISKILIKRKVSTDVTAKWVVVGQIDINGDASALSFDFPDVTNKSQTYYQYGLVPVFEQVQPNGVTIEVEGSPIESEEVFSEFDGVFLCDSSTFCKFYSGLSYGETTVNQITGVHQTLGRQYPIIVANSDVNYQTGSITANLVTDDIIEDGLVLADPYTDIKLSRKDMADFAKDVKEYLTNKKPKILKDWNGNIWLVLITDNPTVSYDQDWGMGLPTMTAQWTQIGDAEDGQDLLNAGIGKGGGA